MTENAHTQRQSQTRPRGALAAILTAWGDLRGAMEVQLAERPGEERLVAYAVGGCFALFLTRLPAIRAMAGVEGAPDPSALLIANLVSFLFFTPLFLYGIAAALKIVLRAFGGTGGWYETRLAVFWALIVSAPVLLVGATVGQGLALLGVTLQIAQGLAGLAWLWALSVCLGVAHGLRPAAVFLSAFGLMAFIAVLALALRP